MQLPGKMKGIITAPLLAFAIGVTSAQRVAEAFVADFSPIVENGSYKSLLQAIKDTGSDKVISDNAPVTIFGPLDEAFLNTSDVMEALSTDELASILLNHVIIDANITMNMAAELGCIEATTAGGLKISIYRDPFTGGVDIDGQHLVVDPGIFFNGGVMHGIDGVILPELHEFLPCPEIVDFSPIADSGNYSTFLSVLEQTNNDFTITVNGPNTTIFGPSNAAFAANQGVLDGMTKDQLNDVLWRHMAYGELFSEEVVDSKCIGLETLAGTNLAVRFNETTGTASVNGIPISTTVFDIRGESYVFHAIEGLLVDSEYVSCSEDPLDFSPIMKAGKYSTLLDFLVVGQAGLAEDIAMFRPVTILGPLDEAFARVQDVMSGLTETEKTDTLARHIITNEIIDSFFDVEGECTEYITLEGQLVGIRKDPVTGDTSVNGIPVVEVDVFGNYGVLMGLDGVIGIDGKYVPCNAYSEFLSAIHKEEILKGELKAKTSLTTGFGPTNDAFSALDGYPYFEDGLAGVQKEIELILGHIVPGIYSEAQIKEAGCIILDTFAGTKVRVMWVEGNGGGDKKGRGSHVGGEAKGVVMVNNAKVILADQTNEETASFFHGIDKVILPGSFSVCPNKSSMAPAAAPTNAPKPKSSAFARCLSLVFASMVALVAFH